ncbi:MAG: helix-turn-helix domain-containing protein [Sandaracinaceae bacterium]
MGPAVALYLVAEVGAGTVDLAGAALSVLAVLLTLVPLGFWRRDDEEARGRRRLSFLALAAAGVAVVLAGGDRPSLPLAVAAAVAWPWLGILPWQLAFDTPDRPLALRRRGAIVVGVWLLGLAGVAVGLWDVFGPPQGAEAFVLPAAWRHTGTVLATTGVGVAVLLRLGRRRFGSTPAALAARAWALGGCLTALVAGATVAALAVGEVPAPRLVTAGLVAVGLGALVAGHGAMLLAHRQPGAAPGVRVALARALALGLVAAGTVAVAPSIPREPWSLGVAVAFLIVVAALLQRGLVLAAHRLLAPEHGRLLDAGRDALALADSGTTIEDIAEAVLPILRRATRDLEAEPLLYALDPDREVRVSAAAQAEARPVELSPALVAALRERPGETIVRASLEGLEVRHPELRPLIDALVSRDALVVVPLAVDLHLEGVLVVPRGRRRRPVTLEELDVLDRLGLRLGRTLALINAQERARRRTRDALVAVDRLEEQLEGSEDEVARLRTEARALKAGGHVERLAGPLIAYSPGMRAVAQRIAEIGPLDAPVLLQGEEGSDLDRIAYALHAAGRREGPFVVGALAEARPERVDALLFGEQGGDPGWLRLAAGGTCTLVDLPALPEEAQRRLADALASRQAVAADGSMAYPLAARVVATSPIASASGAEAVLRPELRRRFAPLTLRIPPLRERPDDLPSLVYRSVDRACRAFGRPVIGVDAATMEALTAYPWPGNLAELDSVIHRAVACVTEGNLSVLDLALPAEPPRPESFAEAEERLLRGALARAGGNKTEAARLLGLKRTTFLDKLKRYDGNGTTESGSTAAG